MHSGSACGDQGIVGAAVERFRGANPLSSLNLASGYKSPPSGLIAGLSSFPRAPTDIAPLALDFPPREDFRESYWRQPLNPQLS
jgi:hypothetical protein